MKKTWLFIPAVAVLLLAAGWTHNELAADRQGDWIPAFRGDLVSGIDVTGSLAAIDAGSFGPPQINDVWDFKISMMAPEGSEVKKGQPILGFDTSELQKRLDEKTAEAEQAAKEIDKQKADLTIKREDERLNLAEAQASLRKNALKLESPPELMGRKERRQVELDDELAKEQVESEKQRIASLERAAKAHIALLQSERDHANAVVADTRDAIRRMTILAPRNGTVVYVTNPWSGDKKKVGDSCWRAERVIEIPDLSRMVAYGDVDEVDAGKIAIGQRVTLRLDAHPDQEFHGTIRTAARTVQQKPGTRDPLKVLHVEIALDRSDPSAMRPGMRFQGTVELSRRRNVLLVPLDAVSIGKDGPYVQRRGFFSVEQIPLKLGARNGKYVEVLAGVAAGDRVLEPKS